MRKPNFRKCTSFDRELGMRIYHARVRSGLTRQNLADLLDVSHQQIQKYEKGTNRLPVSRMMRIAQMLDVPVTEFLNLESTLTQGETDVTSFHQRMVTCIMRDVAILPKDLQASLHSLTSRLASPYRKSGSDVEGVDQDEELL